MKKMIAAFLVCFFSIQILCAQEYKVTTNKTDSFSVALIQLLNCAISRFESCSGDTIRRTWMGTDRKLSFTFPGSVAAIVRGDGWDKNVYIEFRGFADKKSREEGIKNIIGKIKKTLGDQLYDAHENESEEKIYFHGLSMKDKNGFFSMNMELFGSVSPAPSYLLASEEENKQNKPEQNFVLLKIYPGIPDYQYYINEIAAPDIKLDKTLKELLQGALVDFNPIKNKKTDTLLKRRKGTDTIHLNDITVIMNYRGGRHSANLLFDAAADTVEFKKQWMFYQQALQAALGSLYIYHPYNYGDHPSVVYYQKKYGNDKPRIYLSLEKNYGRASQIYIKIESIVSYPTKAGLSEEDFD